MQRRARTQDAPFVARSLLMSVYGREAAWDFVKTTGRRWSGSIRRLGFRRLRRA